MAAVIYVHAIEADFDRDRVNRLDTKVSASRCGAELFVREL